MSERQPEFSIEWGDMSTSNCDRIPQIIKALTDRFGRIPTESEVLWMIYGTDEERTALWNRDVKQ